MIRIFERYDGKKDDAPGAKRHMNGAFECGNNTFPNADEDADWLRTHYG